MKMHKTGKMVVAGIAGTILAVGSAHADALLWYRFDGDGAKIENKANPGTMDGTLKSINSWNGLAGLGDTAAKFPTRGDAFPEGTGIIDPATDTIYPETVKSIAFSGDPANSGTVLLQKANATTALKEMMSFTCEVFFKLPSDSAKIETRRAKDILFPLVEWGSPTDSQRYGWFFGLRKDNSSTGFYPFFRYRYYNGTSDVQNDCQDKTYITDSNWHHLAVVVTADTSANTATVKLVLDYTTLAATMTLSNFQGFHKNNNGSFPFLVGADLWRSGSSCCFMGEIAEVRVSNTALAADELLRPLPAGPVDADTLVYLPMGDSGWFGSKSSASYENKFHGILAASTNTAWTPYWVHGSTSVAYPAISSDSAAETIRGGYLSAAAFADTDSVLFSRVLDGTYKGHAVRVPYEGQRLAEDSFTLEWFFKTDGTVPSGNSINSYTFMYPSFAKIMINQADGKLLTRLIPQTGSYSDYNSAGRVDDAAWHHYALVYDKGQGAFSIYLDYSLVNSVTLAPATGTSRQFLFGGETATSQTFAGNLDDLRITKRALRPHEFLTSRTCLSPDTALFAHFDGDYSTSQDAVLAPSGAGGTLGGGSAPTFASVERRIDYDGDERADHVSTQAIRLDGGSVAFQRNSMLECRDFTYEWFAKYESIADGSMLLRFEMGANVGSGTISWALYYPGSGDANDLRLGANVSANGSWASLHREDINLAAGVDIADGRWHHWALVAATDSDGSPANTTFTLYRDGDVFGSPAVFDGANDAGGILAIPTTGTTLSIGTGGKAIAGVIDELRMTPAALAPENFMRKLKGGMLLILR